MSGNIVAEYGRFAIVSHAVLVSGVSDRAFRVYAALSSYANSSCECWPSVTTLAEMLGRSESYIHRGVRELVEAGVIIVEERVGETGGQMTNKYWLVTPKSASLRGGSDLAPKLDQGNRLPTLRSGNAVTIKKTRVREKFSPPEMGECESYARLKGHKGQGELFWRYWDEQGWRRRSGPMRSWQKSLDIWLRRVEMRTPFTPPQRKFERSETPAEKTHPPVPRTPLPAIPVEEWD